MSKRTYVTPVCTCIQIASSALLGTSVIPVGTQTSNQTNASQEDWNEEDKNKGGLGVGGGEFEGNDW